MIGWTKHRKRCPEHGIVLRKENGEQANYCPACGEQLAIVSVPYLFQIYFYPWIMIIPCVVISIYIFFVFAVDVRGCNERMEARQIIQRQVNVIKNKEQDAVNRELIQNMPEAWKTLYAGMKATYYNSGKWEVLRDYFKENPELKLPTLSPGHIKMFLEMLDTGRQNDAFALITKHSVLAKEKG